MEENTSHVNKYQWISTRPFNYLKGACLQIHDNVHEHFRNVFKIKLRGFDSREMLW
jgi:hypothetical protein